MTSAGGSASLISAYTGDISSSNSSINTLLQVASYSAVNPVSPGRHLSFSLFLILP